MNIVIDCLFVGLGGALGAVARFMLSLLPIRHESGFPITTLAINVMGAFCIGLIVALAGRDSNFNPRLLLLLKVGLCGGFTTFSTFAYETAELLQGGKYATSVSYIVLSVLLCVFAVFGAQIIINLK